MANNLSNIAATTWIREKLDSFAPQATLAQTSYLPSWWTTMAPNLTAADNGQAPRVIANCRVYERQDCSLPTTCQPATVGDAHEIRWNATIRNISQGGVCLHLPRRFEKGTGLAVELPGDLERDSSIAFVKVIHLRRGEAGGWILGCKFISDLCEDEVQRLVTSTHHVLTSKKKIHDD